MNKRTSYDNFKFHNSNYIEMGAVFNIVSKVQKFFT